jgi:predicted glycosyltransferase
VTLTLRSLPGGLSAASRAKPQSARLRVALYSPGMVGLGHVRRNLLLARTFADSIPDATFLLVAEAREAGTFEYPARTDCFTLPALQKESANQCRARYLDVELGRLTQLRSSIITGALDAFDPDVLVVDHLPRGALGELTPALERLAERGRTRLVLGLRDVLEEPEVARSEWMMRGNEETVRDLYDEVWIYGDPRVFDNLAAVGAGPEVRSKTRYTGYLNTRSALASRGAEDADRLALRSLPDAPLVLCQVGGGHDGVALAEAFVQAKLPEDTHGVLVTGPFMPREVRKRLWAGTNPRMHVLDFIAEPMALFERAERVITMGGYNSVCEVVGYGKPALVVPRVRPRREQLIRARRLSALGAFDMLHPDDLTPAAISAWLARAPGDRSRDLQFRMDMDGLARASANLGRLLGTARPAATRPLRAAG